MLTSSITPAAAETTKWYNRSSGLSGHLCPIRSRHLLEFLEIVRWESVPRGPFNRTWKRSSHLFSQPDWLPLGLRGWCGSSVQLKNGRLEVLELVVLFLLKTETSTFSFSLNIMTKLRKTREAAISKLFLDRLFSNLKELLLFKTFIAFFLAFTSVLLVFLLLTGFCYLIINNNNSKLVQ